MIRSGSGWRVNEQRTAAGNSGKAWVRNGELLDRTVGVVHTEDLLTRAGNVCATTSTTLWNAGLYPASLFPPQSVW